MKVLYFHQHFITPKGAGGIRSYAMARHLIERGHEVTMVCGSFTGGDTGLVEPFVHGARRGRVDGINVIEFDLAYSNNDSFLKRSLIFLKFAIRSVWLVFREQYDLVFATTTPLTAGIPGIVARWLRGKTFVFEVRDLWPELPRAMGVIRNPIILCAMSVLEWASYKSAHRLIGLSSGIVDGISRRGVPCDLIAMIPNGCDLSLFDKSGEIGWRPHEISKTDLMAVFAGTHGIANGLDALLDVAVELKNRKRNDIKLLLIGSGKLKLEYMARAVREELGSNLIFHEPVDKKRLAELMVSTDIGLQILANVPAFYYGTSPNKFFDYIAAGLPVINNYPGWVADLIVENDCGYVVPPGDYRAFADALEKAANDRGSLKIMGSNARKLAIEKFDRAHLADRWVDWVINE